MPAIATIYRWLDTFPIFQEQYTRARLRRADSRADKIDTITDQLLSGEVPPDVARVAIAAIQWQASKENRDLYGDRQTIRHEDAGDMAERLGSARDRADNVVDIKTVKNKA